MKKTLLLGCAMFTAMLSFAQPCSDVFISEYVEGWSNNKAIEIFNPTENAIDLSGYGIVRFPNGSPDFGNISYLTGVTIQPAQAFVVVLDKQDQNGTGLEAPVWDDLQTTGDLFINPTYDLGVWPMYFNGNDAVAIIKNNGNTLVDLFGKINEGTGFGGWGPLGNDDQGNPMYVSEDHTLIRKSTVEQGVNTNPSSFDIYAEWDSLPANTFDNLGTHISTCAVGVHETSQTSFQVFPNPIQGDFLSIVSDYQIETISVMDISGKRILEDVKGVHDTMQRVDVSKLEKGVYIIEVTTTNGRVSQQRVIR